MSPPLPALPLVRSGSPEATILPGENLCAASSGPGGRNWFCSHARTHARKQRSGWSREPEGQRPLLLTTHSEVGAAGEFSLAVFFRVAFVEAPVALVYIGDDQLITFEPLTRTHKH